MSVRVEHYRFAVRGRTAAEWTALNEILLDREIGLETDTRNFKFGTGVTPWNSLEYAGGGGGGSKWLNGATAPGAALGEDGDYYLRTSNGDVYEKEGGAWTVVANIKGRDGDEVEMRVADGHIQWKLSGSSTWIDLLATSDLRGPRGDKGDKGDVGSAGPSSHGFPTASFHAINGDIQPTSFCEITIPFGFTIKEFYLTGNAVGILEIDIRANSFASAFPPGAANSICGLSRPRLVAERTKHNDTLSDWAVVIPSGTTMRFIVTACSGIRAATIVLVGERT